MMMFKNSLNKNYYFSFYKRSFTTSTTTFGSTQHKHHHHLGNQTIVNPIGGQPQYQIDQFDHGFEKVLQFSADENVEANLKNILKTKLNNYGLSKQPDNAIDSLKQYLDLSYTNGDLVRVEIDNHNSKYLQNVITVLKSYNHVSYIVKGVKQV
ncbi:hypothetical protein CYY_005738 [Polysphondylium violaceum]|uniref:Uncharacterized protein n=1 Tax=Polysphondylium violaceum TaxID=133409 RepID=A0A8J4UYJ8_9MYCE|nr:hypothetical protein CYY_005738 [Polysphondylium violaceum]